MTDPLQISVASRQYVKVAVDADDPTADPVQLAFIEIGAVPASDDWHTGDWQTISGTYYARCLIGPGGTVELAQGRYQIWVKVTDAVEVPVLQSGILEIL